jgi:transposase InsO family protein
MRRHATDKEVSQQQLEEARVSLYRLVELRKNAQVENRRTGCTSVDNDQDVVNHGLEIIMEDLPLQEAVRLPDEVRPVSVAESEHLPDEVRFDLVAQGKDHGLEIIMEDLPLKEAVRLPDEVRPVSVAESEHLPDEVRLDLAAQGKDHGLEIIMEDSLLIEAARLPDEVMPVSAAASVHLPDEVRLDLAVQRRDHELNLHGELWEVIRQKFGIERVISLEEYLDYKSSPSGLLDIGVPFVLGSFQAVFRILPNLSEDIIIVLPSGFFSRLPSSIRVKKVHRVACGSKFLQNGLVADKNFLVLQVSPASSMYIFSDTASSPSVEGMPLEVFTVRQQFLSREKDIARDLHKEEQDKLLIVEEGKVEAECGATDSDRGQVQYSQLHDAGLDGHQHTVALGYCYVTSDSTISKAHPGLLTLFDTGANRCLIRRRDLPRGAQIWSYTGSPLLTANNTALHPIGVTQLYIRSEAVAGRPLSLYALVVEDLSYPLLLGTNFLGRYKAQLCFDSSTVTIQNHVFHFSVQDNHTSGTTHGSVRDLHLLHTVKLPPYSALKVPISSPFGNVPFLASPSPQGRFSGAFISRTLWQPSISKEPYVMLANWSPKCITVTPEQVIGEAIRQDAKEEVFILELNPSSQKRPQIFNCIQQPPTPSWKEAITQQISSRIHLTEEQKSRATDALLNFSWNAPVTPSDAPMAFDALRLPKEALASPIASSPYPLFGTQRDELGKIIDDLLQKDIIEPSHSEWASPCLLVPKTTPGKYRLVIDYRKINALTVGVAYPLPHLESSLSSLGESSYFSAVDLTDGFWQMHLPAVDRHKTAFTSPFGLFQFKRLPMGLKNAPAVFQHYINVAMHGLLHMSVLAYVDDLLIYSRSFDQHLEHLKQFSDRLREFGLRVNPGKCQFFADRVTFLGHEVSAEGIAPSSQHKEAIKNIPRPQTLKQIRTFLGMCSFFRRFVKHFTEIAQPLQDLVNRNHFRPNDWTDTHEIAFCTLKEELTGNNVFLAHPDFSQRFQLVTDASDIGLGGVLLQKGRPISYLSRSLKKDEVKLPPAHKEALAVVWCCEKLRPYLIGREFDLLGDNHPLVAALNPGSKSRRLTFWAWKLQEFSFVFKHRSGKSAEIQVADCFSRTQVRDSRKIGIAMNTESQLHLPQITPSEQQRDPECLRIPAKVRSYDSEGRMLVKGRLFVPNHLRRPLLHFLHLTYAHIGSSKLYALFVKHYYWNRMRKDVLSYVRQCLECQCAKAPKCKFGMLRPFQAGAPGDVWNLDVVGPLRIQNQERYFITAVDSFGGWPEAKELDHCPTSEDLVSFLIAEVIARHGVPRKIVCDNGSIMVSEISRLFYRDVGVKIATTSSYHPQSNGKVERFHRFLKETLRASKIASCKELSDKLSWILFAYRTTYHESIKEIPFFIYHGFDARNPVFHEEGMGDDATSRDDEISKAIKNPRYHALQIRQHYLEVQKYVNDQRNRSMQKMKKIYDGPRTDFRFQKGDYVLLWDHRKRKNLKLSRSLMLRWRGPFRVLEVLSPTNYRLQYVLDNSVVQDSHVIHIRPFDGTQFLQRRKDEQLSVHESRELSHELHKVNVPTQENLQPLVPRVSRDFTQKLHGKPSRGQEDQQPQSEGGLRRSARIRNNKQARSQ